MSVGPAALPCAVVHVPFHQTRRAAAHWPLVDSRRMVPISRSTKGLTIVPTTGPCVWRRGRRTGDHTAPEEMVRTVSGICVAARSQLYASFFECCDPVENDRDRGKLRWLGCTRYQEVLAIRRDRIRACGSLNLNPLRSGGKQRSWWPGVKRRQAAAEIHRHQSLVGCYVEELLPVTSPLRLKSAIRRNLTPDSGAG